MKRNMKTLKRVFIPTGALTLALATLIFIPAQATAHGERVELDACTVAVGHHQLNVASYQSGTFGTNYCQHLPKTGPVSLFIDLDDRHLRSLPIAIEIYESHASPQSRALVSLPARTYPQGSIVIEHPINAPGKYVAVIALSEDGGTFKSSFPFTVGSSAAGFSGEPPVSVFLLLVIAAGVALYRIVAPRIPTPAA